MKHTTSRKNKKLPVEVTEEEFTRVLEHTISMHHKVAFMLAWESGLRISEVKSLKPTDFNFTDGTLRVNDGKGGKDRIVGIPEDWMEHHMKHLPIKCTTRALQFAFTLACKKSGVYAEKSTVHFHSLRHGFATHMVRNNAKLSNVQMLLGHEDLSTTAVYIRLTPMEAVREQKEIFGK